jgi:hypothetical protein
LSGIGGGIIVNVQRVIGGYVEGLNCNFNKMVGWLVGKNGDCVVSICSVIAIGTTGVINVQIAAYNPSS